MRWQRVYHILTFLAGVYDVVTALIDCGDDTFITLRNANDDIDSFDHLSGIPPIHIPDVAILEPGAELTYFEKSNLSKRVSVPPERGSGRDPPGTQGTRSGTQGGTQGTGPGSQGTGNTQEGGLGPNEPSGGKDVDETDRKLKEALHLPDDGGSQSTSPDSYTSVLSFKTVSSTTTPGAVSTVTASSSVMASANAISTSISTTTAAATSGAKKTRFALFSVAVACLAMIL